VPSTISTAGKTDASGCRNPRPVGSGTATPVASVVVADSSDSTPNTTFTTHGPPVPRQKILFRN